MNEAQQSMTIIQAQGVLWHVYPSQNVHWPDTANQSLSAGISKQNHRLVFTYAHSVPDSLWVKRSKSQFDHRVEFLAGGT